MGRKVAKTTGCNLKKSCAEILLAVISIVAEKMQRYCVEVFIMNRLYRKN